MRNILTAILALVFIFCWCAYQGTEEFIYEVICAACFVAAIFIHKPNNEDYDSKL